MKSMVKGIVFTLLVFGLAATLSPLAEAAVPGGGMPGGWSSKKRMDSKAKELFNKMLDKHPLVGVKYTPWAYSTQVVAGTNYKFYCTTETMSHRSRRGQAVIQVYVDLDGDIDEPKITPGSR